MTQKRICKIVGNSPQTMQPQQYFNVSPAEKGQDNKILTVSNF